MNYETQILRGVGHLRKNDYFVKYKRVYKNIFLNKILKPRFKYVQHYHTSIHVYTESVESVKSWSGSLDSAKFVVELINSKGIHYVEQNHLRTAY